MNDRFKFRFYDKKNNFMITDEDSDKNWNKCIELYDKDEWYFCVEKNLTFVLDYFDDKDFVVMQCTGLKDKNGKLIYEDDIVKGKDHFDRDRKCIVKYSETYCCYFIVGDGWSDEFMFNLSDKEVIGNIYENKELLEEYKDE